MMLFEDYLQKIQKNSNLSQVKLKILKRLWHDDNTPFPKPWVSSKELLDLTAQKYFDRRARELRDQSGCNIETEYRTEFSGSAWRLKSGDIAAAVNREYLTAQQRALLFSNHNNSCATCGKKVKAGVRGLQADHKIPLSRGGGNSISNWQPLCHNCNVGKRRACEGCSLDCNDCSWAFPELVGIPIILNLTADCLKEVKLKSIENKQTINEVIENALWHSFKRRD